jgi:hypothetical protein
MDRKLKKRWSSHVFTVSVRQPAASSDRGYREARTGLNEGNHPISVRSDDFSERNGHFGIDFVRYLQHDVADRPGKDRLDRRLIAWQQGKNQREVGDGPLHIGNSPITELGHRPLHTEEHLEMKLQRSDQLLRNGRRSKERLV